MDWPGNLTPESMGKCSLIFRQYAGESAGPPCVGTASTPDVACAPPTEVELAVPPAVSPEP